MFYSQNHEMIYDLRMMKWLNYEMILGWWNDDYKTDDDITKSNHKVSSVWLNLIKKIFLMMMWSTKDVIEFDKKIFFDDDMI